MEADAYFGLASHAPVVNGSTCTGQNFHINGILESTNDMDAFALDLPKPVQKSCTISSINPDSQHFYLQEPQNFIYSFGTQIDGAHRALVWFSLYNPAQDHSYICYHESLDLNKDLAIYNPEIWFKCLVDIKPGQPPVDEPRNYVRNAVVNYEVISNTISYNFSWSCADQDPDHP